MSTEKLAKYQFDHIVSDPHYKHDNIRNLAKRPFETVQEMDEMMILLWNRCVQPGQKILCLGDFSLSKDRIALDRIMQRLQGDKYIIPGNHDHWLRHEQLRQYWTVLPALIEFETIHVNGKTKHMVASHFPLMTWNRAYRGSWMIHGHCHGNLDHLNVSTTRMDCGVDPAGRMLGEYRPFTWREICQIMDKKIYTPVDHHGSTSTNNTEM